MMTPQRGALARLRHEIGKHTALVYVTAAIVVTLLVANGSLYYVTVDAHVPAVVGAVALIVLVGLVAAALGMAADEEESPIRH